jgi:type II secretory pathway pseudopilin PulG
MRQSHPGFTLVELLIGAVMMVIAITALMGAFFGQTVLNEHARNLTWAVNDAGRVLEQMRRVNTGDACAVPDASAPAGYANWNAWLAAAAGVGGGGKSIQPTPNTNELIVVTCRDNTTAALCGDDDQVSAGEWAVAAPNTNFDPIQVSVAVCWRHGLRTIGECTWNAGTQTLTANDADGDGTVESPGMLSTVITCRR